MWVSSTSADWCKLPPVWFRWYSWGRLVMWVMIEERVMMWHLECIGLQSLLCLLYHCIPFVTRQSEKRDVHVVFRDGFSHLHLRKTPDTDQSGGYSRWVRVWQRRYLWRLAIKYDRASQGSARKYGWVGASASFPRHLTVPQVGVAICGWPTCCNMH